MRTVVGCFWAMFLFAMLVPGNVFAWGEIRVATTDLNVRAARRADAPLIVTLKKGQEVKVDFIEGKWAAIFAPDAAERVEASAIGYAGIRYLQYRGPAPEVAVAVPVTPEPMEPSMDAATPAAEHDSVVVRQEDNEVVAKVQDHVDQVEAARASGAQQPVKITSDRMVYNEAKRTVVFEGEVRADHQDLTLFSETLTAYFAKDAGDKKGEDQIERIVAGGGVKVLRDTTEGRCATLTYMVQSGVLRMEGNPILKDGDNTITGEVIKFFLKDNRSEVMGGKKRVQAVFTAPGDLEP